MIAAPVVVHTRLLQQHEQSEAALRASEQRLHLLATAGAVLSRSLEPQATLEAIASMIVPGIADWCRIDLLDAARRSCSARSRYHADPDRRPRSAPSWCSALPGAAATRRARWPWVVATGAAATSRTSTRRESSSIARPRSPRLRAGHRHARELRRAAGRARPHARRAGGAAGRVGAPAQRRRRRAARRAGAACGAGARQRAAVTPRPQAALAEAESANRAKDEFLAMLGHELRNPLAPIVTALQRDGAPRRRRRAAPSARIIERQVAHLTRLVDDLLDVSRITAGKIELERERARPRDGRRRARSSSPQPVARARARTGSSVDLPDEPVLASTATRCASRRCCRNLLTNAAKYTPRDGRIALAPARDGDEARAGRRGRRHRHRAASCCRASSTCSCRASRRCDRPPAASASASRSCRRWSSCTAARVAAESDGPGRGSRFIVACRVAEPTPRPRAGADAGATPARAGRRRASSSSTTTPTPRRCSPSCCARTGHEVRIGADGAGRARPRSTRSAPRRRAARHRAAGHGRLRARAARCARDRALRAACGWSRSPATATSPTAPRALAAGFDEHLVKPVHPEALMAVIERMLQERKP